MARYQVIATEQFSLQEFCIYAGFSEPVATAGSHRRDVTDALATVSWYRRLHQLSEWARPYAIGLKVEPKAYWNTAEHERFHRNKWPKYARGLHRPQAPLVCAAEHAFPGSSEELSNPIWIILKHPPGSLHQITKFEEMLDLSVRLEISRWSPRVQASKNGSIKRFAGALEQIASLDALTAMILQCHKALLSGKAETACKWVAQIYRGLLILGVQLYSRGIALPLFELLELRLLNDVSHDGWRYYFPATRYLEAIGVMSEALWHIEGRPYSSMSNAQKAVYMRKIMDGGLGWDLKFALSPIRLPCSEGALMWDSDLGQFQRGINLFLWAWNMHRSGRTHPQLPPPEVFNGTDLRARSSTS